MEEPYLFCVFVYHQPCTGYFPKSHCSWLGWPNSMRNSQRLVTGLLLYKSSPSPAPEPFLSSPQRKERASQPATAQREKSSIGDYGERRLEEGDRRGPRRPALRHQRWREVRPCAGPPAPDHPPIGNPALSPLRFPFRAVQTLTLL
jgi:hypothetical protein